MCPWKCAALTLISLKIKGVLIQLPVHHCSGTPGRRTGMK